MKKYLLVGVLCATSFFVWWILNSKDTKQIDHNEMVAIEFPQYDTKILKSDDGSAGGLVLSSKSASASSVPTQNQYYSVNSENVNTLEDFPNAKSWKESVGYFSDEEENEYGRLSKNVLEELAKSGDLKAMQTLADQESFNDLNRAKELYYQAAVYGSIPAIRSLKSFKVGEYLRNKKTEDAMEAYAYLHVIVKRGDLNAKYNDIGIFSEVYDFYPNDAQLHYIENRSNQIMEDLERRRRELGLPAFDNRPAKEYKELYDRINRHAEYGKP